MMAKLKQTSLLGHFTPSTEPLCITRRFLGGYTGPPKKKRGVGRPKKNLAPTKVRRDQTPAPCLGVTASPVSTSTL